jgi:hypothetical protein
VLVWFLFYLLQVYYCSIRQHHSKQEQEQSILCLTTLPLSPAKSPSCSYLIIVPPKPPHLFQNTQICCSRPPAHHCGSVFLIVLLLLPRELVFVSCKERINMQGESTSSILGLRGNNWCDYDTPSTSPCSCCNTFFWWLRPSFLWLAHQTILSVKIILKSHAC